MEEGRERKPITGTPQGGVISPLLANIYLNVLDETWEREYRHLGKLVRFADDFVVLCRSRARAEEALRRIGGILGQLGLELHSEKTRIVELGLGKEGFVFLGCYLRIVRSHFKGKRYLFRWPCPRAMQAVRDRVRDLTDRRRRAGFRDIREVIEDLNPVLRGWGNYFRTGNAARKFLSLDRYVVDRLNAFRWRRHRRHAKARQRLRWTREEYEARGLHRLRGTIRYPKQCMLHRESPPVSRVREIRMHGLKGGGWKPTA